MLKSVCKRSKERAMDHDVTLEWIQKKLEVGVCELTGIPFDMGFRGMKKGPFSPSIDRIDSAKGYLKSNCRVVLWALNMSFNWWGEDVLEPIMRAWLAARDKTAFGCQRKAA